MELSELDKDVKRELEETLTIALIRLGANEALAALQKDGWLPCRSGYSASVLRDFEDRKLLRYFPDSNTFELSRAGAALGNQALERLVGGLGMLPESPGKDEIRDAETPALHIPVDEDDDRMLRVRIELDLGAYPSCWREIDIPARATFLDLHLAIQRVFCWNDEHVFSFEAEYDGQPVFLEEAGFGDEEVDEGLFDDEIALLGARRGDTKVERPVVLEARTMPLGSLLTESSPITYRYNLTDGWTHAITLASTASATDPAAIPYLAFGAGDAPPEGTEGIEGYKRFRTIMSGPRNAERAAAYKWSRSEGYRIFELTTKRRELSDFFPDDRKRWAARLAR